MSEVKWIKIVTDIFDDEKILLIEALPEADSIIVIWFKLLCLAGKQNNSGVFVMGDKIPYTDKMLATIFRRNENIVKLALNTFEQFGMIEIIDNVITIPNWEKHQTLDQLELAREQTRKRVAKHREKQKKLVNEKDNCNVTGNVTVTQCNGDRIDKIREDKNNIYGQNEPDQEKWEQQFEQFYKQYPKKEKAIIKTPSDKNDTTPQDISDTTPSDKNVPDNNTYINNIYSPSKDERENSLSEDFEKIWQIYPRKEGKAKAFKSYAMWLKGKKVCGKKVKLTNRQIWFAVRKYADESKEKEKTFIKMGSTFFADAMLDYVEVENEQVSGD